MCSFAARLCLLVFGLTAAAAGIGDRDVNDDPTSTSSTVTVTATVTVTSLPPGPTTVTVTRTSTRSVWSSTVLVTAALNCTRTIFTANAATASAATPPVGIALGTEPGFNIIRRQGSESPTSSPTTTTPAPTPTTPTIPAAPTTTPRVTRTRTIWVVTTAVQTTPYTGTNYQCSATLAYLLTTDATRTVPYTLTRYPSTVTATSTISCPFGFGGFGGFGGLPTPTSIVPPSLPTVPSPPGLTSAVKRQITNSTTITTPGAKPTAPSNPIVIQTIHLTRTTYSVVTFNATAAATAIHYECSTTSYDATVTLDITRTAWPSTTTVVSVLECGLPGGRPPVTSTRPTLPPPPATPTTPATPMKRQTDSSSSSTPTSSETGTVPAPTSATVHRTRTVRGTVTVTGTVPTTRIVYSCTSSAAAVTPTVTPTPP